MQVRANAPKQRRGFTLVELLVVLLIFGILTAIAVPSLISTQPQRNLAAAGDRFANDFNYARAKAEATKNRVFIAFETSPDPRQIEGRYNSVTNNLAAYPNACNPGVARIASSYIIVEERPRFRTPGSSNALFGSAVDNRGQEYTYLDWLNQYDAWVAGNANYPVEPLFPYNATETAFTSPGLNPSLGPFNAAAAPLLMNYQNMTDALPDIRALGATDFSGLASIYASRHLGATPDWAAANTADQQYKIFCVQDQAAILAMDDGVLDSTGLRFYDPAADGIELMDQVVDYVLLKRVTLPEHCVFVNPWKSSWVVGWEDRNGDGVYGAGDDQQLRQEMQFLQYLWCFNPPGIEGTFGGLKLAVWTYDPLSSGAYHGTVRVTDDFAPSRHMWMTLQECVDTDQAGGLLYPALDPATSAAPGGFGAAHAVLGGSNLQSNIEANKKANLSAAGRMFTFSTMGSKYYVEDYTPNDSAALIADDNVNLNVNYRIPDAGGNMGFESPIRARELGYSRNFLVP